MRLGSERVRGEGLRLGTVRRPPRGVPKAEFSARNFYDIWLPALSPSPKLIRMAQQASSAKAWAVFAKAYRREMARPEPARLLELLAGLSRGSAFSVGCYCEDEQRCHRSLLRGLLEARGAKLR